MPYIDVKLTKKIDDMQIDALKSELGKAISLFPGKTESWLMCNIEGGKKMFLAGDNSSDCAFVEVKLFGSVDKASSDMFTRHLCDYMNKSLSVSPDRVYVRYEGGTDWGWNGSNF